jgi:hypothetical protein
MVSTYGHFGKEEGGNTYLEVRKNGKKKRS